VGHKTVKVNRAPVLTLWAAIVAKRLGFKWDEALTLGRAIAGLSAYAKGRSLGLFEPAPERVREERRKKHGARLHVDLMGRAVPVLVTPEGLRAEAKGQPVSPDSVTRYLQGKFGDALPEVREAMTALATSIPAAELGKRAFRLYEAFRPSVPAGAGGWGAAGTLSLEAIVRAAKSAKT
jgi:hypothetical protein